jgi:hypothetical protein
MGETDRNLNLLNTTESFLKLKHYFDLTIGHQYRILSCELKEQCQYGARMTVILMDEEDLDGEDAGRFLYFLSPSYAEPAKVQALENLLKRQNFRSYLILEKCKTGKIVTPVYKFVQERK